MKALFDGAVLVTVALAPLISVIRALISPTVVDQDLESVGTSIISTSPATSAQKKPRDRQLRQSRHSHDERMHHLKYRRVRGRNRRASHESYDEHVPSPSRRARSASHDGVRSSSIGSPTSEWATRVPVPASMGRLLL